MAQFHAHSIVRGTSLLTSAFEEDDILDDAFDAITDTEELLATCDDPSGMP